ncbi:methyltransferase domain-containing protein [Novosphingobium sp. ERN07]|uniref:class I SAM-dependent methyltransferase n=1 Tax=Novosphingobium sp. ERN07 TaxID=2726187 RepID=UPI001456B66F|nr:class I SAM-dependent methyltransferase [Novosphingobium sp. ERN07]NLR73380.1 methyltransferase domain-containing protein [Novosphingobium sp. ERN07]
MIAAIEPGDLLLDVATGPGALALAAAQAGAIVTAIDFSQAMIDRLVARTGSLPITARQMDGQALDLPDATFDIACSVFGVPLFSNFRSGLSEMARVLRRGGRSVIAVADNPWGFGPNRLLAAAREELRPDDAAPPMTEGGAILADAARLASELEAAGFEQIEVHRRTHDFVADPGLLAVDSPMIGANPMLAGLDDEERAKVVKLAATRASELATDGVMRLASTALIALGRRT